MSKVRSKDTGPELLVRKYLFANGFRFRKHVSTLPGKPDIVLAKYRTVIFVHGCFWHGHVHCKHSTLPNSNIEYWTKKIQKNITKDHYNINTLRNLGWRILTVWECEVKTKQNSSLRFSRLIEQLVSFNDPTDEVCDATKAS